MNTYKVTLKHDGGRVTITTTGTTEQDARDKVRKAEGAPYGAVLKVERVLPNPVNVMVCTDCYFAHHYGVTEIERTDDDGATVTEWFVGDSDTPADRKPLGKLDGYEIADNTCSDHTWPVTDDDGDIVEMCECGNEDSGQETFSWSPCEGCGSRLGGSRERLALFLS